MEWIKYGVVTLLIVGAAVSAWDFVQGLMQKKREGLGSSAGAAVASAVFAWLFVLYF